MSQESLRVATAFVTALTLLFSIASHAGEKKVVLQISDDEPEKQTLVLNVANNLVKHYGQDGVKVEIVAFGPGLKLLFADNANHNRVQSLSATGVNFNACQNTTAAMTRILGYAPKLAAESKPVPAGIARIVDLTAQGYTLVRP